MTTTAHVAYGLIGGGATDLDYIDGTDLADGDIAFVYAAEIAYFYKLDDDSAAAESSPAIISPDTNAGDKRWILQGVNTGAATFTSVSTSTIDATGAGGLDLRDDGTNVGVAINDGGSVNLPKQPSVLVKPAETQSNLATDSDVTIVFDSEIHDQASNFASNTFTAPVDGIYAVGLLLRITGIDQSASRVQISIITSNRTYYYEFDPSKLSGDPGYWAVSVSLDMDMDASDTLIVKYNQTGGAAQADINTYSFLSVRLAA